MKQSKETRRKKQNPSPKCPKFGKILKLQIFYLVSCTKIEMFLHVLVLTYKKFNTIFKCLFRNKTFSCLHLFDSLHRSQICLLFLAELFTFTSSSQKIIPCKIRAALLQNTLLTITWKESLQLFSIITANPTAPQSLSLSHHTEPDLKLFSNVDHDLI